MSTVPERPVKAMRKPRPLSSESGVSSAVMLKLCLAHSLLDVFLRTSCMEKPVTRLQLQLTLLSRQLLYLLQRQNRVHPAMVKSMRSPVGEKAR